MYYRIGAYGMRPLAEGDLRMVLAWRNSARVKNVMVQQHDIAWEEHLSWFNRIKTEMPPRHFIFLYKDSPIGYIGYEKYTATANVKTCNIGMYLGTGIDWPWGAGVCLWYVCFRFAFEELGCGIVESEVFAGNERSLKLSFFWGAKYAESEPPRQSATPEGDFKLLRMRYKDFQLAAKKNTKLMQKLGINTAAEAERLTGSD